MSEVCGNFEQLLELKVVILDEEAVHLVSWHGEGLLNTLKAVYFYLLGEEAEGFKVVVGQ